MDGASQAALIGRNAELRRVRDLWRLERNGADYLWITGETGCGKTRFLQACVEQAVQAGWEVLQGKCTEDTRTDPYGPFLSTLGLCFDKSGRLINDRSVYSVVDQISLDDVFGAVADIPGMSFVAFGIKVGMTIFESRRHPQSGNELLNRNFEFILQLFKQIERKRKKPVLLALDDLHQASTTTYALIEYLLARIDDARTAVVATWQAGSPESGETRIREVLPRRVQPDRMMHLPALSGDQMRQLLGSLCTRPLAESLETTLIEFGRGLPGILVESLRHIESGGESDLGDERGPHTTHSVLQTLVSHQLAQVTDSQRVLLQCASLVGQRIPLDVLIAPSLCTYLGMGERALLSLVVQLADQGTLLTWDSEDAVRFTSALMRTYLRDQIRAAVSRRDNLRIAEAWRSIDGEARPAVLAQHYLAGGEAEKALAFALQSAEELSRSAAYPEAVQSYRLALQALERSPHREGRLSIQYDVLRAMALAAEQTGDWDEALARLENALALSEGDIARQAEINAGLGWLRFQRGQVQSALQHLGRSAELYESVGDAQGRAHVDYYLGVLYSRQKEWQRAVDCFEQFLDASQEAGFSEGRASALAELGNLCRLQRHWSQAQEYLRRGIDLAQAEGDYVVLAQCYHYLGSCYAMQGKAASIDILHQALDIARTRTKQPAQESRIQNTLAETLVRMNRWQEAEQAFRASAAIKERLGDRAGLAITHGGLGRLYLRQWRFDLAVEYLQRDIDLLTDEFDANVAWIQQHTNLIGEARRLQGNLDRAAERFADAIALAASIPDESVRRQSCGYTHMLLARLAVDRGEMTEADGECAAALDLLANTWAEGQAQLTAARIARMRGDVGQARRYLDKALAYAGRSEDSERASVYLEQVRFYRDVGDQERMREWAGKVTALAQQLQNSELERRVSQLLRVK